MTISPHNSGVTNLHQVVEQFAANYARYVKGEIMMNIFDFNKGY